MKNHPLSNRLNSLPDIRGHFHRPRIDELLDGFLDRHLIVVTAGAGWGKTHAVSAFLKHAQVRAVWFPLTDLDNHLTRFWTEWLDLISRQNKKTAARLEELGFPETLAKFDRFLHILANEIYSREQVVFVFDDFHLVYDERVMRFIENLVHAKFENFCIIINTRERLSLNLNIDALLANEFAGQLTAEDLCFTPNEAAEYFKQQDVRLSSRECRRAHEFTGGWPLALYLVGLSVKKGGSVSNDPIVGALPFIFDMIERELFSEYTPQTQQFLIRLSLLQAFPEGLLHVLAGEYFHTLIESIQNSMFINRNPATGQYSFHQLFLEFLTAKQPRLTQDEITDTYKKAAQWCAANDYKLEALTYYDKCGSYDEILSIMFHFGVAVFTKTVADFYIRLIDKFPAELMKQNPILHVHRAGLYYNNAEVQSALAELLETQKELEALPPTEGNRAVLGEVMGMLGLINLGMANDDFTEQFVKASEYLPHGGMMIDHRGSAVNTRYAMMLSNPAPGALQKMEDAMFYAMPYASKAMRGYGQGMEYLAAAEAAYFTGDMKKAAVHAYAAVYRAREKRVVDVACSGYFLLMRVEAANGNYDGIVSNLEQMNAVAESLDDKWNFNGMPDVAEGWFHLLTGRTEKITGWLVDTAGDSVLAPYSMGMERSVKARFLLREGKVEELLAWLEQSEKPLRQYGIWIILLELLICKAVAFHAIRDEAQTVATMRAAYEIAHGNNLIMPFTELGNDIRKVIYQVRRSEYNTIPEAWLQEIYTKADTYEKHLRSIRAAHQESSGQAVLPFIRLTKREQEVLRYLYQGLKNTEIASACFITLSTVKKTLNRVYIKLGATNRADAVRIALQLELHR